MDGSATGMKSGCKGSVRGWVVCGVGGIGCMICSGIECGRVCVGFFCKV